jgi:hypothetical protein
MREHKAICGECFELWPCAHMRAVNQAELIVHRAALACEHCRLPVDSGQMRVRIDGRWYHGRAGKCRRAAIRELHQLGREDEAARVAAMHSKRQQWFLEITTLP